MKYNDFNWDDIILEAPEEDVEFEDELGPTDYAEAEDMDIEEAEPTDDVSEGEEEISDEDMSEEDSGSELDDLTDSDPLADDSEEGGSDENPEDEQNDNMEDNVVSDKQNINLVNDFIELYTRIDQIIEQLRTDCKTNVRYNPNMLVAKRNLDKLKELTYDYIVNKFAKESYVTNLYQFNLIIQALNVNIELIESILKSNKKFMEEFKKNKKAENKKKR